MEKYLKRGLKMIDIKEVNRMLEEFENEINELRRSL